ncbi:MAG: aldehyde:ferredoxin oxidoreductase [Pirellulaceae bacterium]|jgi:aldehyde:ferredoxin oxidoreductase
MQVVNNVDLTRAVASFVEIPELVLRRYLGGSGLGTYLLLKHGGAESDPLSPEAPLVFAFSPLVGSPLTTSAKFAVVSKSPLTGRINDSLASSGFAIRGKAIGADAIVITGKAASKSIVVIESGEVRLESAASVWGLDCRQTETVLNQKWPDSFQFAVIGPAGEEQIPFATVSHNGRHAGRGGSGAILGAKQVKAIAVSGDAKCDWGDAKGLLNYAKALSKKSFGPATAKYRELGTAANLLVFNRLKTLPTRNFQQGSIEGAEVYSPEIMSTTREKTRASCAACTIGCEHLYSLGDSKVRIEYENLFALGSLCGIVDADLVLRASLLCDELGLDTISAGGTIAFAMECVERGLLDEPWLKFGSGDAVIRAINAIAQRDGVGKLMALGSRHMAMELGGDAIDFAAQVKGMEIPGYEPRGMQAMAVGFAVGTRGADHNRSGAYEVDFSPDGDRLDIRSDAVPSILETENKAALMDSLILCKFLRGVFTDFFDDSAEMLALTTGWDVTADELRETAARIVNIRKHFNILAGWQPHEDTLPERFFTETPSDAPDASLSREQLQTVVEAYNKGRGWSDDGWLPAEIVDSLGLDHQAD